MEATKQVKKNTTELIRDYLQATGLKYDDRSVEIFIKFNHLSNFDALELAREHNIPLYKTIDKNVKKKYEVTFKSGKKEVVEADSPIEAIEKIVGEPIEAETVRYNMANVMAKLINGQKKSVSYYRAVKKDKGCVPPGGAKVTQTQSKEKAPKSATILSKEETARQKALIQQYALTYDNERQQQYELKETAYVVELDNGDMVGIRKPDIQTRFCYGYDGYGHYENATESEERARKNAEYARTSADNFVKENMEKINTIIERLENKERYKVFKFINNCTLPDNTKNKDFILVKRVDEEFYFAHQKGFRALEEVTDSERERLLNGHKKVAAMFEKRLQTYLKRYGLSKLNVWTYCSD